MTWIAGARGRVITGYTAQYADPITFARGETITVTDRVEPWRDNPAWLWVWCEDARGKSGWVPEGFFERRGEGEGVGAGVGLRDYSAVELSVALGERLTVEDETAGWLLCLTVGGRRGWIPLECVGRVE